MAAYHRHVVDDEQEGAEVEAVDAHPDDDAAALADGADERAVEDDEREQRADAGDLLRHDGLVLGRRELVLDVVADDHAAPLHPRAQVLVSQATTIVASSSKATHVVAADLHEEAEGQPPEQRRRAVARDILRPPPQDLQVLETTFFTSTLD